MNKYTTTKRPLVMVRLHNIYSIVQYVFPGGCNDRSGEHGSLTVVSKSFIGTWHQTKRKGNISLSSGLCEVYMTHMCLTRTPLRLLKWVIQL